MVLNRNGAMDTITVNNHKFVAQGAELGEDSTGFFKRAKRSIYLFDRQNEPMAVINQELVLGNAIKIGVGKTWYTYMPSNHVLYNDSLSDQARQLETLARGRDHRGYIFK